MRWALSEAWTASAMSRALNPRARDLSRSIDTVTSGLSNFRSLSTKVKALFLRTSSRNLGSTLRRSASSGAWMTNWIPLWPARRSPMLASCVMLTRAPVSSRCTGCSAAAISCCERFRSDLSERNTRTNAELIAPWTPWAPPEPGTWVIISVASGTRSAATRASSSARDCICS